MWDGERFLLVTKAPAERFDGTPFTDRGFASVPALTNVAELLDAMVAA